MRRETLALALGEIDDELLEKFEKRPRRGVLRLAAAAACLTLAVAALIYAAGRGGERSELVESLATLGLHPEVVESPQPSSGEIPAATEDLAAAISGKTAVRGTVTDIETVRLTKPDGALFITVFDVAVEEVLSGGVEGETVRFISAAEYTGMDIPPGAAMIDPRMEGVALGSRGVFAGRPPEGTWEFEGAQIDPSALADLLAVLYLPGE